MSKMCLDCFNREFGKEINPSDVILDESCCKACGEMKPCILRLKNPWGKGQYFLGIRDQVFSEDNLASMETEEDIELARMMEDFAQQVGTRYNTINEKLLNDLSAAVPEDMEQKALDYIDSYTKQ